MWEQTGRNLCGSHGYALLIESKVQSRVNDEQLRRHLQDEPPPRLPSSSRPGHYRRYTRRFGRWGHSPPLVGDISGWVRYTILQKYNPKRKKTFSAADWELLCTHASAQLATRGLCGWQVGSMRRLPADRRPSRIKTVLKRVCACWWGGIIPGMDED